MMPLHRCCFHTVMCEIFKHFDAAGPDRLSACCKNQVVQLHPVSELLSGHYYRSDKTSFIVKYDENTVLLLAKSNYCLTNMPKNDRITVLLAYHI